MPQARRTITLDPASDALLSDLAESGGASRYVEQLIADAERDWRSAHQALRAAGWQPRELAAACDALNGFWQDFGQPASWTGMELVDYERISSGATQRWGVEASRWMALAKRVQADETEARCLLVVAREFWRGNPRLEKLVTSGASDG